MGRTEISDRDRLGHFLERVERVAQCEYITDPTKASWKAEWKRGHPIVQTTTEPSAAVLESFLLRFRPFVMEKEPVYLPRIYNICDQRMADGNLKQWLRQSRQYWLDAHRDSGIRLNINGNDYKPWDIADLWINGFYFHDDPDKRQQLEAMQAIGLKLHRVEFLHFLDKAVQQVFYARRTVQAGLKEGVFRF